MMSRLDAARQRVALATALCGFSILASVSVALAAERLGAQAGPISGFGYLLPFVPFLIIAIVLGYFKGWRPMRRREHERSRREAIQTLFGFLWQGKRALYDRRISSTAERAVWQRDYEAWCNAAGTALEEEFGIAERRSFDDATPEAAATCTHAFDANHKRQLAELAGKIERLNAIGSRRARRA